MTLPELIGVHFGDGATPDEQAMLSRALISDEAALREFVIAARLEGVLQARAEADDWADTLAARLDVEGIACPTAVAERPRGGPAKLAATALTVLAVGFGGLWLLRQRSSDANGPGATPAENRRPPAVPAAPLSGSGSSSLATATRAAAPDWAARFYLPRLEFENQPLDTVLEQLLASIAEANHLQRPELSAFELAWQPLNDASASNPPRVTVRQSQVPLSLALEWIAILSDCRVQWDDQGARMIESPPESASGPSRRRTMALSDLLGWKDEPGSDASPASAPPPSVEELLETIGLAGPLIRSARLDAAAGTMSVELTDHELARLEKVLNLRAQNIHLPFAVTARFFALPVSTEPATAVMGPDEYRTFAASLAQQGPAAAALASSSVACLPGEPFQLEAADSETTTGDRPPRGGGLRVNGLTQLSGELIRVSATLHIWSAAAGNRPNAQRTTTPPSPPPGDPPAREFTTEFEAFLPLGHTAVFALSEADQVPALALHLTIDQAEPTPAQEPPRSPPSDGNR